MSASGSKSKRAHSRSPGHSEGSRKRWKSCSSDAEWNAMFVRMAVWKSKRQNSSSCMLGIDDAEDDPDLVSWAQYQRSNKAALANTDRLRALNALGFCWNLREEQDRRRFEERFQKLLDYKKEHGNLLIPTKGHALSSWVNALRYSMFNKKQVQSGKRKIEDIKHYLPISDEYEARLNAIGFVWKCNKREGWDVRVEELKDYKRRFGHTKVPQHWPENKQLGKWVAKNRAEYNCLQQGKPANGLTEARVAQLNELGFDWGKARPNARKYSEPTFV